MNENLAERASVTSKGSRETGSLDNLRDIVELPAVSWWPPAPGWWMLLALLLALCGYAAWRYWRAWHANAYRRAAVAELRVAASTAQIAAILKRTALVAYPRIEVASMTGTQWCAWLASSADLPVSPNVQSLLTMGVYGDHDTASRKDLIEFAVRWIDHHPDHRSTTSNRSCAREREAAAC